MEKNVWLLFDFWLNSLAPKIPIWPHKIVLFGSAFLGGKRNEARILNFFSFSFKFSDSIAFFILEDVTVCVLTSCVVKSLKQRVAYSYILE